MEKNKTPILLERIKNHTDLTAGLLELRQIDPILGPIIDGLKEIPLRLRPAGFEGLAEIITAQQVSKASATAIFGRLTALINPFTAEHFINAGEQPLIEAGLSRAKQSTLTGLAQAMLDGEIDLENLCLLPVNSAIEKMVSFKGIGPWTAEVFLLFCAGHSDIFPAGDVALQHAAREIYGLDDKPDPKLMRLMAERWAPLRGVAARVLYAQYAHVRQRPDLPV